MSSGAPYPPAIQTNGSIYNSDNYSNSADGSSLVSTNESNVFTQLQYCSSADTSTVIPTTQWVQGAILNGATNSAYVNVANTFSAIQSYSAILLLRYKVPLQLNQLTMHK